MASSTANDHRDFVSEYQALMQQQEMHTQEKQDLYLAWAENIKRRIAALHNPETGRTMSVSAFQSLLPGYDTKSPILLNALGSRGKSVKLLIAATSRLDELERDERYRQQHCK